MLPSNYTKLVTYEGVNHTIEELGRRYNESVLEIYDELSKKTNVIFITSVGPLGCFALNFVSGKWDKDFKVNLDYIHISREYPPNGLVAIGNNVYLLSRMSRRQWRRGANPHTIEISQLYVDPLKKGSPRESLIYAAAFSQTHIKPSEFTDWLKGNLLNKPVILSDKVWAISKDNYLVNLYYEDIFVGMCDKDKKYIPCKEAVTLVEETLDAFGIQAI